MTFLTDTHTFLWYILGSDRLSLNAKQIIEEPRNTLFLSMASMWEIAIKVNIRKIELHETYEKIFPSRMTEFNFIPLEFSQEHFNLIAKLPLYHRDPFDRMLIAQSLTEDIPILSTDSHFDKYGVTRIS
jgi:PIN domain nuclease of toxin-antitoxin system